MIIQGQYSIDREILLTHYSNFYIIFLFDKTYYFIIK